MARQEATVKTWEDVNPTLRRIGELDRDLETIQCRMNELIDKAKAESEAAGKPLLEEKKRLAKDMERYCVKHRAEIAGSAKTFTHGRVVFRFSTRLVIHSVVATLAAIRDKLGRSGEKYVRVKEEPDKDALGELPEETLLTLGVIKKSEEKFSYDIDKATIADA